MIVGAEELVVEERGSAEFLGEFALAEGKTIASPFFAKPEMAPSDFRSKKLATRLPAAARVRPASATARYSAPLRTMPRLPH